MERTGFASFVCLVAEIPVIPEPLTAPLRFSHIPGARGRKRLEA